MNYERGEERERGERAKGERRKGRSIDNEGSVNVVFILLPYVSRNRKRADNTRASAL
jgi:hypothetical protein